MVCEVRVDLEAGRAVVRLEGSVDERSLFEALRLLREKDVRPNCSIIWDGRRVRELVLGPGDLRRLLGHLLHRVDPKRKAPEGVVIGRAPDFNLAQLYKALAERAGYTVRVSWTMEEALEMMSPQESPHGALLLSTELTLKDIMSRKNTAEENGPAICSRCGQETARYSFDRETGEHICPACLSAVDLPLMATSLKAPNPKEERPGSQGRAEAAGSLSHTSEGRYDVLTFPKARLAYVLFEGTLDWPLLKAASRYVFEETGCDRNWHLVWDLRKISRAVLKPGELNRLTEHVEAYVREGRRPQEALVITAEETVDVIARLYQHLASVSGYSVRLASTLEETLEYLEAEPIEDELRQQLGRLSS